MRPERSWTYPNGDASVISSCTPGICFACGNLSIMGGDEEKSYFMATLCDGCRKLSTDILDLCYLNYLTKVGVNFMGFYPKIEESLYPKFEEESSTEGASN